MVSRKRCVLFLFLILIFGFSRPVAAGPNVSAEFSAQWEIIQLLFRAQSLGNQEFAKSFVVPAVRDEEMKNFIEVLRALTVPETVRSQRFVFLEETRVYQSAMEGGTPTVMADIALCYYAETVDEKRRILYRNFYLFYHIHFSADRNQLLFLGNPLVRESNCTP